MEKTFWITRECDVSLFGGPFDQVLVTKEKVTKDIDGDIDNYILHELCSKEFKKVTGFLPRKGASVKVKLVKVVG